MKYLSILLFNIFLSLSLYSQTYEYDLWLVNPDDPKQLDLNQTSQSYNINIETDSVVIENSALSISFLKNIDYRKISLAKVKFGEDIFYYHLVYYQEMPKWIAIKFILPNGDKIIYWFHRKNTIIQN